MSYSRYSNSKWYTFWDSLSGETKETQIFTISNVKSFSYKDLTEDIDACLAAVNGDEELKGYMMEFIHDMDEEFTKNV